MKSYEELLSNNKNWAATKVEQDPNYFSRLVDIQTPNFLWIGCSDSRVPADQITGTQPGEIFVHRNIANMVVHTDLNLLSVLQYAVEFLKVKHVIVCGHYGCGGVKAAMTNQNYGILNKWLCHIKDVYHYHKHEVNEAKSDNDKLNKLIELNVQEQVNNLAKTSIIQKAWKQNNMPHLHGWVYDLHDGIINPIIEMAANSPIEDLYKFEDL